MLEIFRLIRCLIQPNIFFWRNHRNSKRVSNGCFLWGTFLVGRIFRKNLKINISFKLLYLRLSQILCIFMPSIGSFRTYLTFLLIRTIILNLALTYCAISPISTILASAFPLSTAITSMTFAAISRPTSVLSISIALSPTGTHQKSCRPGLGLSWSWFWSRFFEKFLTLVNSGTKQIHLLRFESISRGIKTGKTGAQKNQRTTHSTNFWFFVTINIFSWF